MRRRVQRDGTLAVDSPPASASKPSKSAAPATASAPTSAHSKSKNRKRKSQEQLEGGAPGGKAGAAGTKGASKKMHRRTQPYTTETLGLDSGVSPIKAENFTPDTDFSIGMSVMSPMHDDMVRPPRPALPYPTLQPPLLHRPLNTWNAKRLFPLSFLPFSTRTFSTTTWIRATTSQ